MHAVEFIEAKKSGAQHSAAGICALIEAYVRGKVPDYQMAAWLMAVRWQGLSREETLALTGALVDSGRTVDLAQSGLQPPYLDKHSTGGVGDKLSLIVVPLLMASGATVVKLSGSGLGHTGGTIDKLASIPGFRSDLDLDRLLDCARQAGGCLGAQTQDIVPADGMIYALRDATATVDSLPLIAASIMSKKLATGAQAMVLDVKVGRGAFLPDLAQAEELAHLMVDIACGAGRRAVAVLTAMDEPLGLAIGNSVEVNEALVVLAGGGPSDVRDISVVLTAEALVAAGVTDDGETARQQVRRHLDSGQALECFLRLVAQQGGDTAALVHPNGLPPARLRTELLAPQSSPLARIDALAAGRAAVALGAGRSRKGESIDPGAGIRLAVRSGQQVEQGQVMAVLYSEDQSRLARGVDQLQQAFDYAENDAQPARDELHGPGKVLRVIGR